MQTKTVGIRAGKAAINSERAHTLQEAIDLADGTTAHIHEGPVNPETGYPRYYDVCYGDGPCVEQRS